jgi:hypothetical protein
LFFNTKILTALRTKRRFFCRYKKSNGFNDVSYRPAFRQDDLARYLVLEQDAPHDVPEALAVSAPDFFSVLLSFEAADLPLDELDPP